MKKTLKIAYFLLLIIFCLTSYSPTLALDESDFNRNYLISDEEMQDANSMDRADIQAFLNDYESYLAIYRTEDKDGVTRLASDIIYRASQEYKINPKYLLVKLQKEQSLITAKKPTEKQLDGATGYGINDGCGWECEVYLRNKGFGKQVSAAAGIIRWYYENVNTHAWIRRPGLTTIISGEVVIPQNYATAFLYTYTPHLQGNKNFWLLWQRWFGQSYPDGSLVKSLNDPTVYLLQDGKKRAIKSMGVLVSRFDPKMILTVPASELANYTNGPDLAFPNYSILKQGENYYLVDFDTIRPFASFAVVQKLGYNPAEFTEVSNLDLQGYIHGNIITIETDNLIGRLVLIKETNGRYLIKDDKLHPISDPQIGLLNFPNLKEEKISIADLRYKFSEPLKFPDGTLIGVKGDNKIYVIENGKKRHIANEEVFNKYGYNWRNTVWTDEITGMTHPTGQPIYLPTRLANTVPETSTQVSVVESNQANIVIGKMLTIPENETIYLGEKFTTPVNTYLVADYVTEDILMAKNIDVVRPLASFTKVMSAHRLFQEGINLNGSTTYSVQTNKAVYHMFRTVEGEKFLNRDLLLAMLVSSLNTPTRMLTKSIEPNENLFIFRMNEQVEKWGLTKTRFTDTYGYDLGNVGTAREFFTIFKKVAQDVTVREFMGTKSYEYNELKDLDGKPYHYDNHSNKLVNTENSGFTILASKTGYLDEAGAGLAMLIERTSDKKRFVVITMGNPNYNQRFNEPKRLVEWVIKNL